jgi:hypothetical protein
LALQLLQWLLLRGLHGAFQMLQQQQQQQQVLPLHTEGVGGGVEV